MVASENIQDTVVARHRTEPSSFIRRLRPPHEFNRWTASYRDKDIETAYQAHLVREVLKTERLISYAWVLIYFLYGILDLMVISEGLTEILIVRWLLCTPIAFGLVVLTHFKTFKPYFPYIYTLGVFMFSISIVWMIGVLPAQNPPPYIIGVITVFIFAACMIHMPFPAAAAAFLLTAIAYSATMLSMDKFTRSDVISGHFFMVSSTFLAIATNYVQEIRSRIIWRQRMLRERDAIKIEELLIEATAADQSKINFLSMMSHELRTPLHQIIGFSEIVRNTFDSANDDDENVGHLSQIQSSAQVLLARIQKMLRYADTTAGKIKYDFAITSTKELVESSLEQMRTAFERKGIRVDISGLQDAKLYIDIFHTCYALNTILENALNASPMNGRIWISGELRSDNGYTLAVKDEGVGMTPEQVEKAMKPFMQSEQVLSRTREGVGLGLTLANRILRDQKAKLALRSKPSAGTTVTIEFEKPDVSSMQASN